MIEKYFIVTAKCGHVRKSNYILIDFAVIADTRKEAASKVIKYKRVKHHHKDVIRDVKEVSFEEYIEQKRRNNEDPYLHCKNIQEQRKKCDLKDRIIKEKIVVFKKEKCIDYKINKIKTNIKSRENGINEYIDFESRKIV